MNSAAYAAIKATNQLPSPNGVVLEVLRLTNDESASAKDLGAVITRDPALSARLLKTVNSPLVGVGRTIASAERAVVLLGFRRVAQVALGISLVAENAAGTCTAFDYGGYWSDSLARAVAASRFARILGTFSPDEAFTVGLLSKIGRLGFATAYPERYSDLLSMLQDDPGSSHEVERDLFGMDHDQLGQAMLKDWFIPEMFSQAVGCQDDLEQSEIDASSRSFQFLQILRLSSMVAKLFRVNTIAETELAKLNIAASRMDMTPAQLQDGFDSMREEWQDVGRVYSVRTKNVLTMAEIYSRCAVRDARS